MEKESKLIFSTIKIILFFIPFSLLIVCPLYFCSLNLFFPYITGKAIFFRILIEIALALTIILLLKNPSLLPKKEEYLFWASLFLLIGMIIILPFSIRPYLSFWGNAERMEGVWGLAHFIFWFMVLYLVFKIQPEYKKTIFYSFLSVLFLMSLIEISQYLKGIPRPDATLGNPTYVGFFSVLMLFILLYFLKSSTPFEKLLIFLGIFLSLLNIFISQTRGSILALSLAIPVMLLYYFLTSKTKLFIKILLSIFIILLLISFYLLIRYGYLDFIPLFKRISDTLKGEKTAYMARWLAWKIFFNAWKQRPLFGYGLENAPVAYYKAFNPEIYTYEEVIFDRPHNKYIEILATTGIVGGIFWLLFFLSIIYSIFHYVNDRYLKGVILGFFLGYLGQNLTLFDIQASLIPFFFGLSLLFPPLEKINGEKRKMDRLSLKAGIGGLLIIGIALNLLHLYIVHEIIKAINSPYPEGLKRFIRLASLNTQFLPEIAWMAHRYLENNVSSIKTMAEIDIFTRIYQRALEKDPYEPRLYSTIIIHLSRIINAKKLAGIDYQEELREINQYFKAYSQTYPLYPDIKLEYAQFLQNLGYYHEALKLIEEVKKEYRESTRVIFLLANLYYQIGEKEKAYQFLQENFARGFYPENIIQYLISIRILYEFDKAKANSLIEEYQKKFKNQESLQMLEELLKNLQAQ